MNLDDCIVADIETVGFLEDLSSSEDLHVFGYAKRSEKDGKFKLYTVRTEEEIRELLENPENVIVGHNFYLYDIPAIKIMFPKIDIKATIIDSLFLSWYIDFGRVYEGKKFGLASYGEDYGVPKPEIESWTGLTYEEYAHRVKEDCKINTYLWLDQLKKLRILYKNDDTKIKGLIKFLMSKASVYQNYQDNPFTLDVEQCKRNQGLFERMMETRIKKLQEVMPKVIKKGIKTPPKEMYKKGKTINKPRNLKKKNGELTASGKKFITYCEAFSLDVDEVSSVYIPSKELRTEAIKWLDILEKEGLPETHNEPVEVVLSEEAANPQSVSQVKDWLYSHGWKPEIFQDVVNTAGEKKKVPQLKTKSKKLCPSVLKLAEDIPEVKELTDLSLIQHRLGYFKGFLKNMNKDGTITAGIGGLTNTLRIKHRNLVNLIKPSATYGEYVRSLLTAPEGKVLIGSDLSSLENMVRNNFIFPIDPDYVREMDGKYFDSHLDIGVTAGLVTDAESLFYRYWKEVQKNPDIKPEDIDEVTEDYLTLMEKYSTDEQREELHHKLDKIRSQAKIVSYSALYGVGKHKLSKELKCTVAEAETLLVAYWKRNYSVKEFASQQVIKKKLDSMWVKNPLNGYWYSLRTEKDIASTLFQGTGDYIFSLWTYFLVQAGLKLCGGFHDECIVVTTEEEVPKVVDILKQSLDKVNKVLKLELPIGLDYKVGLTYAEVH